MRIVNSLRQDDSVAHYYGDTEKAIAALEDQWIRADRTNNPDLAAPLLAEKYICTWMDGSILNKAQTLAGAKARLPGPSRLYYAGIRYNETLQNLRYNQLQAQ